MFVLHDFDPAVATVMYKYQDYLHVQFNEWAVVMISNKDVRIYRNDKTRPWWKHVVISIGHFYNIK